MIKRLAYAALISIVGAISVLNIDDCPVFNSSRAVPDDITDLRIDDIKVIGSLGDRQDLNWANSSDSTG